MTQQETKINLTKIKEDLIFNSGRSCRYHDKRSAFFDILDKFLTFLSLMFSSATIAALMQQSPFWASAMAIVSSAVSALSLVGGFAIKSRNHFDFKRQWYDLCFEIEQAELDAQLLADLQLKYQRIEREEPAVMYWVNELCYNEQCQAMGFPDNKQTPIPLFHRLTAHFHNFH